LRRALSNTGDVLIGGKLRKIRGVVCMDTAMVEVDDGVSLDDEVIIIGKQGDLSVTPADHARCAGTIPYEILKGISERVKRIYLREGLIGGES
jgi:alanine racemase